MLTSIQREEIHQILLDQISELEQEIASMKETTKPVALDSSIGRLTRMDNLVNRETVQLALDEAMKRLDRLHEKLERINDEAFGRCPMCNEMISMERLRVAPDRGVCVKCLNASRTKRK